MSKDNDVTSLQEYIISGIVVLFFGLLYFYLSGSFLSDNKDLPAVASSQSGSLTSLADRDVDKLGLQSTIKTPSSNAPVRTPDSAKNVATQTTASSDVAVEPLQVKKSSEEDINLDGMKVQVDESGQKTNEVKRPLAVNSSATSAAVEAGKEETPLATAVDTKTEAQKETATDGLVFRLPSGQKVEIPADGFEDKLRKAIVKGDRNTPIVFDRVYFDTGSKNLNSKSNYQVSSTAALLNTYKDINITIRGHTDNKGSSAKNAQLSLFRSGSMKKALVDLGIDPKRIHIEGLGESEPIDSNKTKRGRRNNRRIDLVIK